MKYAQREFEQAAVFESFKGSNSRWDFSFTHPKLVFEAHTCDEVLQAIQLVERETCAGRWAVIMLSYEAAPAFDENLLAHAPTEFPLAWVALFDQPADSAIPIGKTGDYKISRWEPQISSIEYRSGIQKIRHHIENGDTYQVNYTFPFKAKFTGDVVSWFKDLGAMQEADYCAYLNLGRYKILSLSPELFFMRNGERLMTRPMKGTMPRGRWLEEDEKQCEKLVSSAKNRAENLMIVDLLRNDLGKISQVGSIQVPNLFEVETYRTVLQMTSTIESTCRPDVGLFDLLQALYPGGSITGAPKIRTMEIINELEPFARLAYTGCVGFVRPGGDCIFNVAIRTIVLDTQTAEAIYWVGGGITYDSTAEDEYAECLLKTNFLTQRWNEFELFETMGLEEGKIFLLERHIQRLSSSAKYFGYRFDNQAAYTTLSEIVTLHREDRWKVRLFLQPDGSMRTNVEKIDYQTQAPLQVKLASRPVNQNDIFLFHKTTNRTVYEAALREAGNCDDVILWNESGEITESAFANLVVQQSGRYWTPPRSCGLLNGTFKEELLATGRLQEKVMTKDELKSGDSIFLINSVRKWMVAILVE